MFGCQAEVSVWPEARQREEQDGEGRYRGSGENGSSPQAPQAPQAPSNHAPPTRPQAPLCTPGGRGPACTLIWQEAVVRGEPSHPSFQDLCGQGDGGGGGVGDFGGGGNRRPQGSPWKRKHRLLGSQLAPWSDDLAAASSTLTPS